MAEWSCSGLQLRVHRFDSVLSLQVMKILVTGSSGFIGFHLVKKLLSKGHEVIGIDNHNDYYDPKLKERRLNLLQSNNFKFYLQDINDINIKEKKIDIAINLAAQAGVRVKKEKEYLYKHSNIDGFKAFCSFCEQKKIQKIIYASSSSVYSDNHTKKFIEQTTNLAPKSKYGLSKLGNESYASIFSNSTNISTIGLRFFSVYGPWGRPDMAYYLFTSSITNDKKIHLNNNGNMFRDWTYIDDVINGIIESMKYLLSENKQVKNKIINLGNDTPVETKKLLCMLERKLNKKAVVVNKTSKNEAYITHADITKAKNLLGYQPKVSLEKGIDKFLNWYKKYEHE